MKNTAKIIGFLFMPFAMFAQDGKLQFQQGQAYNIKVYSESTVSQEAMGQAIDFNIHADIDHGYVVTNSTADNTTLHHDIQRIQVKVEGMGQEKTFDSQKPEDLNGELGPPMKEILSKSYDMIIDPTGKVLMTKPEAITLAKAGDAAELVTSLMKEQTSIVYPPAKTEASFFKILPDKKVDVNGGWVETTTKGDEKSSTSYTLKEITDSTMVIAFQGTSNTISKAQMMGMETTTKMNNQFSGTIILDKATGIIKEKTTITESNGNTEAMGGMLPVTAKSKVIISVTLK